MSSYWGFVFAAASMFSNVASQQFLSRAFRAVGDCGIADRGVLGLASLVLRDVKFWSGGILAFLCLGFWALALTQLPLSRVLPVMALVFIASPLIASYLGADSLRPVNMVGFMMITVGVVLSSIK
jgi:multidrug transporter EmrE-like cation transporter